MKYTDHDLDILARTLYGEAEAHDIDDARAIACVVVNRMRWPNWPDTAAEVCLQPWQFSCWNPNDPGRARILAATEADPWFDQCRRIAQQALAGDLPDHTNGATHYYASYVKTPKWAKGHEPSYVNTYGRYQHLYFNDIDTPPPSSAAAALDQARPLASTRTVRGAQIAAGGTVLGGIVEAVREVDLGMLAEVKGVLAGLLPYAPYVKWALIALTLVGIAATVYARWDDRRQGVR